MAPSSVLCVSLGVVNAVGSPLQAYNVDPDLTVSGISAGAFFAVQYHVAFSAEVRGAGIVAGGPMHCAQGAEMTALTTCMSTGSINDNALLKWIHSKESSGAIDSTENLKQHAVILWSGTGDHTVAQPVMKHLKTQYESLGIPNIVTLFNFSAGHAWPTDFFGNGCSATASPYINNCGYDYAGEIFREFYGNLAPRTAAEVDANLLAFDQSGAYNAKSFGRTGYVYVPSSCKQGARCKLHINFHGCQQYAGTLGKKYVSHTGLNRWAETNNVIVLYPQAATSMMPSNPNGCLDWWGYADSNYDTKAGNQMKAVKAMVDKIRSGAAPSPPPTPTPTPMPPAPTPTPVPPTPTPDCPGGSLEACIGMCPSDEAAFEACVNTCVDRCETPAPTPAPTPEPTPAPAPTPAPTPTPSPSPAGCTGRPMGSSCASETEYIVCPFPGISVKCQILGPACHGGICGPALGNVTVV